MVRYPDLVMIIDRGLADVGIARVGLLDIGVVAPVLLFWQINRTIAAHEASRRARGEGEGASRRPGGAS